MCPWHFVLSLSNIIFLLEIRVRCLLHFFSLLQNDPFLHQQPLPEVCQFQVLMTCFFSPPFIKISWFYVLAVNSCRERCLLYASTNIFPFCFPSFILMAFLELPLSTNWMSVSLYENQISCVKKCLFNGF